MNNEKALEELGELIEKDKQENDSPSNIHRGDEVLEEMNSNELLDEILENPLVRGLEVNANTNGSIEYTVEYDDGTISTIVQRRVGVSIER
jgi:hypothetical protein